MTKQEILEQIKRLASKNGGVAPGRESFQRETGVTLYEINKYWARWSNAVDEAGLVRNQMQASYEESFLIEKLIDLIREIGRFPAQGDFRVKAFNEERFPHASTFRRLGLRDQQISRVSQFCAGIEGMADVARFCEEAARKRKVASTQKSDAEVTIQIGLVYLIKAGRYHKIGKTKSIGRRIYDLAIQLAEEPTTIHVIKTDDPDGIEKYWHNRFAGKRKKGEWFDLSLDEINAFKKWVRIA